MALFKACLRCKVDMYMNSDIYGEYGAWADREYMYTHDNWSQVIESTHALLCATFALGAIINKINYF